MPVVDSKHTLSSLYLILRMRFNSGLIISFRLCGGIPNFYYGYYVLLQFWVNTVTNGRKVKGNNDTHGFNPRLDIDNSKHFTIRLHAPSGGKCVQT